MTTDFSMTSDFQAHAVGLNGLLGIDAGKPKVFSVHLRRGYQYMKDRLGINTGKLHFFSALAPLA
jgi:hypothetical protein